MTDYMFSPSIVAFYPVSMREAYEASDSWPEDGVLVSEEVHSRIMDEQSAGRIICAGPDGQPMTKEPPPPTVEEQATRERVWRNQQLKDTDTLIMRHRDELEFGTTTLSAEQYQALQVYRRQLRDWPELGAFPLAEHRPTAPDWLYHQIEDGVL